MLLMFKRQARESARGRLDRESRGSESRSRRRKRRFRMLAIVGLVLVLVLLPSATGFAKSGRRHHSRCKCRGAHTAPPDGGRFRKAVLCLHNMERHKYGLPRLHLSSALDRAAARHARDMVRRRYFAHVSPGGRTPLRRARAAGYRTMHLLSVGENQLFWSPRLSPNAVIGLFLASPHHRTNIMRRRWRDIGIASVLSPPFGPNPGLTVVVEFGARG
jgi:uncharacterized protein YkwD